jgi:hypothetical protein
MMRPLKCFASRLAKMLQFKSISQLRVKEAVSQNMAERIEMADRNLLDIVRSRLVEQEVLDLIDEPETR